jgi:PIN domain nuclease of toxin-antitoxin system
LDLIFDTHALVWFGAGSSSFSKSVLEALEQPDCRTFVSAVTAWEYSDLVARGRLPGAAGLHVLQKGLGFELLDLPAGLWRRASVLPAIHRDPIDRMLIAHALEAGLVLVTADRQMRDYPVQSLW